MENHHSSHIVVFVKHSSMYLCSSYFEELPTYGNCNETGHFTSLSIDLFCCFSCIALILNFHSFKRIAVLQNTDLLKSSSSYNNHGLQIHRVLSVRVLAKCIVWLSRQTEFYFKYWPETVGFMKTVVKILPLLRITMTSKHGIWSII